MMPASGSGEVDRLATLRNIRDRLIAAVESAEPRELPSLSKELRATLDEIERLAPPTKEGSRFDELAARRARRIADTTGEPDSAGQRGGRG